MLIKKIWTDKNINCPEQTEHQLSLSELSLSSEHPKTAEMGLKIFFVCLSAVLVSFFKRTANLFANNKLWQIRNSTCECHFAFDLPELKNLTYNVSSKMPDIYVSQLNVVDFTKYEESDCDDDYVVDRTQRIDEDDQCLCSPKSTMQLIPDQMKNNLGEKKIIYKGLDSKIERWIRVTTCK